MTESKPRPEISVIIPVYNTEKYLEECLDSVLAQTLKEIEIILVDDGSTDGSPAICDAYAAQDYRVRVFHQENQGQAAARNFAVNQAAADWVAFVDGDDVLHPQYLEALFNGLGEGAKISMCSYVRSEYVPEDFYDRIQTFTFETLELDDQTYATLHDDILMFDEVVWRLIISREILLLFPFENGRISEDSALVCSWYTHARKLVLVNFEQALYFYRKYTTDTKTLKYNLNKLDLLWAHKKRLYCFKEMHMELTLQVYVRLSMIAAVRCYDLFAYDLPDHSALKKVRQEFRSIEKEFGQYAVLSNDEQEWVMARFHPVKLYMHIIHKKIKEYGLAGLIKKAFERIHK